jgi:tRNA/rRNA methyltransferase
MHDEQPPLTPTAPRTVFVLIEPSHAGNVGAAARAIKTMGFQELVLVRPVRANVLRMAETIARASGALDVLREARVVDDLADALRGVDWLCATAMTPRDFGPPTLSPRQHFTQLAERRPRPNLGLLFGTERHGMSNEDVYRCHACLRIPTNPAYGSLNLAQALQVLAYEWRMALGGFDLPVAPQPANLGDRLADAQAVQGLVAHWEQALHHIGYLDPKAPKKLMPRLNQVLNRAQVTQTEVHVLRGIARNMLKSQR